MKQQSDRDRKRKQRKKEFEALLFQIVEKSLEKAIKQGLDDIFKEFK